MRDALRGEWTKLRTSPGTPWAVLAVALSTAAVSALAVTTVRCPCATDTMTLTLVGVQLGQAVAAVFAVGVLGGEYGTGMITVTFAATPRRLTVLAAKAVLVAALVAASGAVGVGAAWASGHAALDEDFAVRPVAGSVLYLVLVALLGLGAAAVTRGSAAAVGVVLGLLYVGPIVGGVLTDPDWRRHFRQVSPADAGLAVQSTLDLDHLPIQPWQGLGVLALWAAAGLAAGAVALARRDA